MNDHNLELLKDADPVDLERLRATPPPRDQLMEILAQERPPTSRRSRRARIRLVPIGVAAALAAAAVLALLPASPEKASPDAVRVLEAAAGVADAQAAQAPLAGYAYHRLTRESVGIVLSEPLYSWVSVTTIEQWVAPDGSGRIRETPHPPRLSSAGDERRWREDGSLPLPEPEPASDERFASGELDSTIAGGKGLDIPTRDLSTDPGELKEQIRQAAERSSGMPVNPKMFELASELIIQAGSSPELRASLYQVVAAIDGVELTGRVRDPRGRVGTAVSIEYDSIEPTRDSLIFNPETSQPLAWQSKRLNRKYSIGGIPSGSIIFEASARVDTVSERPRDLGVTDRSG